VTLGARPRSLSRTLVGAAALTTAVAVTADLVAGNHLAHVVSLGLLAVGLGVARLRDPGRHRATFGVLSAALVAQPVVHACAALGGWSGTDASHPPGADGHGSVWVVALALALVTAVGAAESLGLATGAGLAACRRAIDRIGADVVVAGAGPLRAVATATVPVLRDRCRGRFARRRGPPLTA
jgi:hypothetical protein